MPSAGASRRILSFLPGAAHMQVTGIQGAEEKPPGARCSAADISVDTAIPADMGQNNPMTHSHTVHIRGQRKIIHMNPFSSFFLGVPACR